MYFFGGGRRGGLMKKDSIWNDDAHECTCLCVRIRVTCTHTLLWGSANIRVKISHNLFNSTRLQSNNKFAIWLEKGCDCLKRTSECPAADLRVRWFLSRACRPNSPSFLSDQLALAQRLRTWKKTGTRRLLPNRNKGFNKCLPKF